MPTDDQLDEMDAAQLQTVLLGALAADASSRKRQLVLPYLAALSHETKLVPFVVP